MIGPVRPLEEVLAAEAGARDEAWTALRAQLDVPASEPDGALVDLVLDDPAAHEWRVVDAALDRARCGECGAALGAGERGCASCDLADGSRFLAREPDRPGVAPGNEHAVRVSLTVVRHPHRWPAWAVAANRLFLPLFAAGDLPTKEQRDAIVAALRGGGEGALAGASSFGAMAARAHARSG